MLRWPVIWLLCRARVGLGMPVALPGRPDLARAAVSLRAVRMDPSLPHPFWRHGHVRVRCYWCGRPEGKCAGYAYQPEVFFVPPGRVTSPGW